mgnify:FL=1|jgi:hypothetical protein
MKARTLLKILAHTLLLSLSVCGVALAQDPSSEWKPLKGFDYTAQTIDGQRINIDSLVRAGKRVVLDFSGTFCRPCWTIHQRGTAERLWKKYGPPGSDEMYFIWIEATGASRAAIEGKEGNTLGDWTNGGTVPYPIVSDAQMADALGIPLSYVPCIVLLSANGTYIEVQDILQISEEGVYNKSKECLSAQDTPIVRDLYVPSWGMTTKTPCEIQAYVGSVSPITKYIWQVNGKDYATTSEPRLILNWPTEGEMELTLKAVNQYGTGTSLSKQIKVRQGEEKASLPIRETFEKGGLIGWSRADLDRDLIGWTYLSQELSRLQVSEDQLSAKTMAHSGEDCLVSWSFYPTEFRSYTNLIGYRVTTKNWLLPPPISIPESGEVEIHLTLYARSFSKQFLQQDSLSIYYVPAPVNPLSWTDGIVKLLTTPISYNWKKVECDLSSFRGQKVQLILAHETYGATGLLIDDVSIEATDNNGTALQLPSRGQLTLVNGILYLETSSEIEWYLYNITGELQGRGVLSNGSHQLTSAPLSKGQYILSTKGSNGSYSYKIQI